jgi:hypothetical protein
VTIQFCISQALAEPIRRQLYQAPVIKLLLASAIVCLGLVVVYRMDLQVGQSLDGHSSNLCSKLCLCNSLHGYFVPHSKEGPSIHTLVFLLLEFHVFLEKHLKGRNYLGS